MVGPADTFDVDIRLTPEVVRLPDLVAKAPEPKFQSAKMEELERRRQMGLGKFLTRIDLKGKEALPLSNVLRGLVGVRTTSRPFDRPEFGTIAIKVINHYGTRCSKCSIARPPP